MRHLPKVNVSRRSRLLPANAGLVRASLAMCLLGAQPASFGFKMGLTQELQDSVREGKRNGVIWPAGSIATQASREGVAQFGEPTHENMTLASKEMARQNVSSLICKPTNAQLDAFLQPQIGSLGHSVCCVRGVDSKFCRITGANDAKPFKDINPILSGARWNDDPCHLTQSTLPRIAWIAWMLDRNYHKGTNFNYRSHYHERQVFHAMSSSKPNSSEYELDSETHKKIMAWGKFSLLVASGAIEPSATLIEASKKLPKVGRDEFLALFPRMEHLTVGRMYTGTYVFRSGHVRLLALGALLHTIQDSYSSSHVSRLRDEKRSGRPVVLNKGPVVGFLSYRGQDSALHGAADKEPIDLRSASPGQDHPVSVGAELIACAAMGSDSEALYVANAQVSKVFELLDPSSRRRGGPGMFASRSTEPPAADR